MRESARPSGGPKGKARFRGGQAPLGYARTPRGGLRPVGAEARIVRRLFAEYPRQKSLGKLLLWLKERGVRNRGREWTRQTLAWILTNPAYTGDLRTGARLAKGTHPPLVGRADFKRVQGCLSARCKNPNRGRKDETLVPSLAAFTAGR